MQNNEVVPKFDDLQNPETIINHIEALKSVTNILAHEKVLVNLIQQIEKIDFQNVAFPESEKIIARIQQIEKIIINADGSFNTDDKFKNDIDEWKRLNSQLEKLKVTRKHYLVLTIEQVLFYANQNKWGMCKNQDFIYLYNGTFWKELDKETFQKFLGEAAQKMGVEKYEAKYFQFRQDLFKQFLSDAYLPTPETNTDEVLINLLNGTFEITSKGTQLRPFKQSDFITYQLPFEYNPKADAPLFQAYLDKVLPDVERQRVLSEYLGYVFIRQGVLKLESALVLYGSGANGKSVFFEIVNALLGNENISSYSLQQLTDDTGYYRAMISNKLVNYASEINGKLETSLFKAMVSGESIPARLPYGKPMQLNQYSKFIFNCNELPKEVEHTNGFFRRWLIIPFDVTIPKEEQDTELHKKIINNELSGVFNWVLDGLNRLLKQKKFSECEAAQKALEQYRTESDSVQMFLQENNYIKSNSNEIPLQELYREYKYYCDDFGNRICSAKTFSERLKNAGFESVKKNIGKVIFIKKKLNFD